MILNMGLKLRKQRIKDERLRFDHLLEEAIRWNKAQILKRYLNHISKSPDKTSPDFLEWAYKKLKWYDPSLGEVAEILGVWGG